MVLSTRTEAHTELKDVFILPNFVFNKGESVKESEQIPTKS